MNSKPSSPESAYPENLPSEKRAGVLDKVKELIAKAKAFPSEHPWITGAAPGLAAGGGMAYYQNETSTTPALNLTQDIEHPDLMFGKASAIGDHLRVSHVLGGLGGLVAGHKIGDKALTLKNEKDLESQLSLLRQEFQDTLLAEQEQAMRFNNPHMTVKERAPIINMVNHQNYPTSMKAAAAVSDTGVHIPLGKLLAKIKDRIKVQDTDNTAIPTLVAGGALAGGVGLGFLEGYRRSAAADPNRALLDSVKLDQATRLGPTGRIPIQIHMGGNPTLQPLGAGAKALVDPNRGSDVFNLL